MGIETGILVRWWTRDRGIYAFALLMGTYEILLGGARPAVLTFISGLLLTPIVMRIDAGRHRRDKPEDDK